MSVTHGDHESPSYVLRLVFGLSVSDESVCTLVAESVGLSTSYQRSLFDKKPGRLDLLGGGHGLCYV